MPGKSHSSKGKHPHHSRKSRAVQRRKTVTSPTAAAPARPVAAPVKADSAPAPAKVASERSSATAAPASSQAVADTQSYPYVTSELRRIGILAGIIIVILIILSVTLT